MRRLKIILIAVDHAARRNGLDKLDAKRLKQGALTLLAMGYSPAMTIAQAHLVAQANRSAEAT